MSRMLAKANASHCVICDETGGVEQNHAGGRNYVAWFTMPFCKKHHRQFHALVEAAGINLEYTPDPRERLHRALGAIAICQWIVLQALRELPSDEKRGRNAKFGNS
jgi:hypothetical protein